MAIKIRCPNPQCGKEIYIQEEQRGLALVCRHCRVEFKAPTDEAPPKESKPAASPLSVEMSGGRIDEKLSGPARRLAESIPPLAALIMTFAGAGVMVIAAFALTAQVSTDALAPLAAPASVAFVLGKLGIFCAVAVIVTSIPQLKESMPFNVAGVMGLLAFVFALFLLVQTFLGFYQMGAKVAASRPGIGAILFLLGSIPAALGPLAVQGHEEKD